MNYIKLLIVIFPFVIVGFILWDSGILKKRNASEKKEPENKGIESSNPLASVSEYERIVSNPQVARLINNRQKNNGVSYEEDEYIKRGEMILQNTSFLKLRNEAIKSSGC
jgi:hypothetical protein